MVWDKCAELKCAIPELLARGLAGAATWAGELLVAAEQSEPSSCGAKLKSKDFDHPVEADLLLGQAYFSLKQYRRAAKTLESSTSDMGMFLHAYATYLFGEKRKLEDRDELAEPLKKCQVVNEELPGLERKLRALHERSSIDGFMLYLYGVVLSELSFKDEARLILCDSVNTYPWNWSAWKTLASLCTEKSIVESLNLNDHWMKLHFLADVYIELQENADAIVYLETMAEEKEFASSSHVLAQTAMIHYNERNFDAAQDLFEELRSKDPHRLENMDTYSNILYVKEQRGLLSSLARCAVLEDKYRPETCCIVGNYYSLRGEHEKAILYFKRALQLDHTYLSAWTLMGHEFVEMRNTAAAIETYRQAVDINPRDYRAWYGLGQAFEILSMHTYSLFYFRKATHLRPYDARMWCAMAESYEKLGRSEDAIWCYQRAEHNQDREGIALMRLAKLYEKSNRNDMAARYYQRVLDIHSEDGSNPDVIDALLFLAQHYKDEDRLNDAEALCDRVIDIGGPARDQAKALQREIQALRMVHDSIDLNSQPGV